jgi:DNA primase
MIPEEKIEEVRERASIVQVVSEYVPLTMKGQNHVGLCPFHSEKTPSFTVSEEKKLFHCFGCQASGNVITFLMRHEGMDFPETVRTLARRYGVTIVEEKKAGGGPRELLGRVNRAAVDFFVKELKAPGGSKAREYLEKRGFGGEMAERFRLGYAPGRWDGLAGYLRGKGFDLSLAERAGLVVKKQRGYYDRFRGRIIFPITDVRGTVVAFGGRSVDGSEPKYLNSPETAAFKKGETLFGLYQAKQAIKKQGYALVVEGYFDLLALHRHGFTNAVATMGTALTGEHIGRLRGYAGSIHTLFDSDDAGKKAALRGLGLFLDEDVPSRVVLLPHGTDPDEFLKEAGPEGMKKAVEGAVPLMDFYLEELASLSDLQTGGGKAAYLDEALEYLGRIKNVAERGHYAGKVASTLAIEVKAIYDVLNTQFKKGDRRSVLSSVVPIRGSRLAESTILRVLLRHPELCRPEFCREEVLDALGIFQDPLLRRVAKTVAASFEADSFEPSTIMDSTEDEEVRSWIAGVLLNEDDGFIESPEKMLEDCVKKVLNAGKPREATMRLIKRLEESGLGDVAMEIRSKLESPSSTKKGQKEEGITVEKER